MTAIDYTKACSHLPVISFSSDDARSHDNYDRAKRIKGDYRSKILKHRSRTETKNPKDTPPSDPSPKESSLGNPYASKFYLFATKIREFAVHGFRSDHENAQG